LFGREVKNTLASVVADPPEGIFDLIVECSASRRLALERSKRIALQISLTNCQPNVLGRVFGREDNLLTSNFNVLSFFLRKNERTKEKLKAAESMTD
jgi:hypothetical protein